MKSPVIPGNWLPLSSVIYSRITLFFAVNLICSKSHHLYLIQNEILKRFCISLSANQLLDQRNIVTGWILRILNGSNWSGNWTLRRAILVWNLSMWFQLIELALRARPIFKSRVWFQTKLHSNRAHWGFNYKYKFHSTLITSDALIQVRMKKSELLESARFGN